jgi:tetratricopeptide (TPR) repeat protein
LAQGQRSRREYQILREALRLDPDCVEAHLLLARRESDPAEIERCYRHAVEAGRRRLGAEAITDPGHPVWRGTEARPFIGAMTGLAWALAMQDRVEEAIDVLAETLRRYPNDELGARYRYLSLLVAARRWDDARALLESPAYRGEVYALWHYSAALVAFKQGREADADAALADAIHRNPIVVSFILDPTLMPPEPPRHRAPGDESEAAAVAAELGDAWGGDRAAMRWLQDFVARLPPPRKPPKRRRGADT